MKIGYAHDIMPSETCQPCYTAFLTAQRRHVQHLNPEAPFVWACAECSDAENARRFVKASRGMDPEQLRQFYDTYSLDGAIRDLLAKGKP